MNEGITVVIPTIPPRRHLLVRAVASVIAQTHPADGIAVVVDHRKEGAHATRHRALKMVRTKWTAFLDDDDEFLPHHLETLHRAAQETGADYVYSWFETVPAGRDPFPTTHFTEPWDDVQPRQTTITTLVKTELAQDVGFANFDDNGELIEGQRAGEDWVFTLGCLARGAKIFHVPAKTWLWHHDSGNTSGRADRW